VSRAQAGGRWAGILLAATGAAGFATKGIFAKYLYARGIAFDTVLTLRALISTPIMLGWAIHFTGWRAFHSAPRTGIVAAIAAGILCYGVGTLLDFYALTKIDASVERVILFSYPSMIVAAGFLLGRGAPSPRAIAAVAIAYLGIFLAVGGLNHELLRANLTGALLVVLCAGTYAVYFLVSERFTRQIGSQSFAAISMGSAAVFLCAVYSLRHDWRSIHLDTTDWFLMAGLVTFASVLPMFMVAEGVRRIGAERSALVSSMGPVATIVLAALILGERLQLAQLAGSALIIVSILVLELKMRAAPDTRV
jgi:drug/metabolite transporter (DMT)-like permease